VPLKIAAEIVVDRARWAFLDGHRVRGAVVVPVALVLEWFARAARACRPDLTLAACRDVQVLRGIRLGHFDEGAAERFGLRARQLSNGREATIAVELLAADGSRHYSAICEMKERSPLPDRTLAAPAGLLPWSGAIYDGEVLFHGPAFQVIRSVDGIADSGLTATLEGVAARDWAGPGSSIRHCSTVVCRPRCCGRSASWARALCPPPFPACTSITRPGGRDRPLRAGGPRGLAEAGRVRRRVLGQQRQRGGRVARHRGACACARRAPRRCACCACSATARREWLARPVMSFAPIAIVGQGCVLPGALSPDELWRLAVEAKVVIGPAPAGRWGIDQGVGPGRECEGHARSDAARSRRLRAGLRQGLRSAGLRCACEQIASLDPLFHWLLYAGREALRESTFAATRRAGVVIGNLSYPSSSLSRFAERFWLKRLLQRQKIFDRLGLANRGPAQPLHVGAARALSRPGLGLGRRRLRARCRLRLLDLRHQAGLRFSCTTAARI
jgi:hypothetical protein